MLANDFLIHHHKMEYRHEMSELRKQLLKDCYQQDQKRECTFSPSINPRSQKMMGESRKDFFLKSTVSTLSKSHSHMKTLQKEQEQTKSAILPRKQKPFNEGKFRNHYQKIQEWSIRTNQERIKKQMETVAIERVRKSQERLPTKQRPKMYKFQISKH